MGSQINEKMLAQLAHLANLDCSGQELQELSEDLDRITSHFETLQLVKLEEVSTSDMNHSNGMAMRDDVEEPFDGEALLKLAPERIGDLFRVPPVLVQE